LRTFGIAAFGFLAQSGQAVMFQHEVVREAGKHSPIFARGLFDHRQEGHGEHDALELVGSRVFQSETQHGQRLARTSGRCEREHAWRRRRCFPSRSPQRFARREHLCIGQGAGAYPFAHVAIQGVETRLGVERWASHARALALGVALEVGFGVEKIGIDQAREQQAHIQHGSDGLGKAALQGDGGGCRRVELEAVGLCALHEPIGIRVTHLQIERMLRCQLIQRHTAQR